MRIDELETADLAELSASVDGSILALGKLGDMIDKLLADRDDDEPEEDVTEYGDPVGLVPVAHEPATVEAGR